MKQPVALVLGANGGIGGATAKALLAHGWQVRALVRDGAAAKAGWSDRRALPQWRVGDAMVRSDVIAAAEGADVILHAVNPPAYRGWSRLVLPMIENSIAAAAANGARIVLPGTLYNYDPETQPLIAEDTPQNPRSKKGAIRVALERRLAEAASAGVPSLIVRAGDFFGPYGGSSWFGKAMVRKGHPVRRILNFGRRGVGHSWAYLPDLAETIARLLARAEALDPFEQVQFHGHWDADGTRMTGAIARAAGRADLPVWAFPWRLLSLAAPFSETLREMREIQPFWRFPVRLDNRRLTALIGDEPHTPLDEAVAETLLGLGCLRPYRSFPMSETLPDGSPT
jgi:nucleoside-diphosphate-sugar epimerase